MCPAEFRIALLAAGIGRAVSFGFRQNCQAPILFTFFTNEDETVMSNKRLLVLLTSMMTTAATAFAGLTVTSPNPLPNGTPSVYYSVNLTAAGGTSPYTWAITHCSGACNTGLGFNRSGILFGTPVNAGSSIFTFAVTDARGRTVSAARNVYHLCCYFYHSGR